jgi:hypothetical protein
VPPRGLVRPVPLDPEGLRGPTRNQATGSKWRRTSQGHYVPSHVDGEMPEQRILEASVLLPVGGVVTGWAALRLARAAYFDGLLADGLTRRPVQLATGPVQSRRRRDGVSWLRHTVQLSDTWVRHGIPCARPTPALFDEIRTAVGLRSAVLALDMACAAAVSSIRRMFAFCDVHPGLNGVPRVRAAIELADEDSWSPGESRLRLIWVLDAGRSTPLCNREVFDLNGRLLGIADLLDPEAGVVGEYDGAEHARASRRSRDAARDSAFRDVGLEVFRVTAYDEHDRHAVVSRIDAAYRRAESRTVKRWTLTPPRGWESRLTLDDRLELREIVHAMHQQG